MANFAYSYGTIMAQPMEIIGRNILKFFISAILLCTITTKIATMDVPDGALSPFMPLQALCNECINDATIESAFNETFNLICTQVTQHIIQQHDLGAAKLWFKSATEQGQFNRLISQIKETMNHQLNEVMNHNLHTELLRIRNQRDYIPNQYFLYYVMNVHQTLDGAIAQIDKKNRVLTQLLDEAITTGQTPAYLYDRQLLREAVEQELSCWTSIKKNCTLI